MLILWLCVAQAPPLYHSGIDSMGADPLPQLPNPVLFFEAKAPWPALGIEEPRTAWEFVQRGMYRQDDLEDLAAAVADYDVALMMEPHLLIAHARLGQLALERAKTETSSATRLAAIDEALHRFEEVLIEQPYRQGLHRRRGDAYRMRHLTTGATADAEAAEAQYLAELILNANDQPSLYALAFLYRDLDRNAEARDAIDRYLQLTELHSDPYPYKILKARRLLEEL